MPKFDFQSQFSISKIIRIFLIFFSLKNIILGAHFLLLTFVENFNFWSTLFSENGPYNICPCIEKSTQIQPKMFIDYIL